MLPEQISSPSLTFTCTVTPQRITYSENGILLLWLVLKATTHAVLRASQTTAGPASGSYLHLLNGRIRIRSSVIKGNLPRAQLLTQQLQTHTGITQVATNTLTGSVLVLYDPEQVTQEQVLHLLSTVGQLPELNSFRGFEVTADAISLQRTFKQELFHTVVRASVDFAVQRLAVALL